MMTMIFEDLYPTLFLPAALIALFIVIRIFVPQLLDRTWPYLASTAFAVLVIVIGWFLPTDMTMTNDAAMNITTRGWLRIWLPIAGGLTLPTILFLWTIARWKPATHKRTRRPK